jgi:hypothetical protein
MVVVMGELLELLAKLLKEFFEQFAPEIESFFRTFRIVLIIGVREFFRHHPELVRPLFLSGGVLLVICVCTVEWMRRRNHARRRDTPVTPQKHLASKRLLADPPQPLNVRELSPVAQAIQTAPFTWDFRFSSQQPHTISPFRDSSA